MRENIKLKIFIDGVEDVSATIDEITYQKVLRVLPKDDPY